MLNQEPVPNPIGLLLTRKELSKIVKLAERTITKYVDAGEFPAPIRIGRNMRWRWSAIEQYLNSRTK